MCDVTNCYSSTDYRTGRLPSARCQETDHEGHDRAKQGSSWLHRGGLSEPRIATARARRLPRNAPEAHAAQAESCGAPARGVGPCRVPSHQPAPRKRCRPPHTLRGREPPRSITAVVTPASPCVEERTTEQHAYPVSALMTERARSIHHTMQRSGLRRMLSRRNAA
jgi:hypothetical protein